MEDTTPSTQTLKIATKFGGIRKLASALGRRPSTVFRWTYEWPRGTGGYIPTQTIDSVKKAADAAHIELTAEDWRP